MRFRRYWIIVCTVAVLLSVVAGVSWWLAASKPRHISACDVIPIKEFRQLTTDDGLQAVAADSGANPVFLDGTQCLIRSATSRIPYRIILSKTTVPAGKWSKEYWSVVSRASAMSTVRTNLLDPQTDSFLDKNAGLRAVCLQWRPAGDERFMSIESFTALTADGHIIRLDLPGDPDAWPLYYKLLSAAGKNLR